MKANLVAFYGGVTRATDVIYLDFCTAFDKVPHNILLCTLERYGFDGWIVQWLRNWLEGRSQRVVVNSLISKEMPVTSGVPQGSVLGLVLFNIFINDLATLNAPSSSLQKTSSSAVDIPEGQDAIQRDLEKLKKWACVNLMKRNKAKCKVLIWVRATLGYQYRLEDEGIESRPAKKDLGVVVDEKLSLT